MEIMNQPAIQDLYPDDLAHCFGCGRYNLYGHQLNSYIEGEDVVAVFTPGDDDVSLPGFVYGGLLASLADCHAMATASAADLRSSGVPAPRYVTASLRVDYLKPTRLGIELQIRGRVIERSPRKKIVAVTVSAAGATTVRAEVVAVRMPKEMDWC
jgi:acyl-coenzyme A thioesterase PaaI-like protein